MRSGSVGSSTRRAARAADARAPGRSHPRRLDRRPRRRVCRARRGEASADGPARRRAPPRGLPRHRGRGQRRDPPARLPRQGRRRDPLRARRGFGRAAQHREPRAGRRSSPRISRRSPSNARAGRSSSRRTPRAARSCGCPRGWAIRRRCPRARWASPATWRVTEAEARRMGVTLREAGINWNLAPVVDVAVNPLNPAVVALGRTFSSDPEQVVAHARAFIQGMHEAGVLTSLKHFPGHGSSRRDSHDGFTDVTETADLGVGARALPRAHQGRARRQRHDRARLQPRPRPLGPGDAVALHGQPHPARLASATRAWWSPTTS